MYWLACWTSDLKIGGSTPSPCHRVVSLDKILCLTLSLSTQVYKWVPATYCWGGGPCDEPASHPGWSSNTLRCFMLRKPGISSGLVGLLGPSATYTLIVRAPIDNSIFFINAEGITLTEINKSICSVLSYNGLRRSMRSEGGGEGGRSLTSFLSHVATGALLLPPGWDARLS